MTDDERLERYVLEHSDAEGEYLHRLWRASYRYLVNGRMVSGHLQGRLLRMLVHMIRPKAILEIGTYSGYSAICMAEALDDDARVYTYEVNDEMEDFARYWIDHSPAAHRIVMTIGDAMVLAPKSGRVYDMVFMDGDKRTYPEMYEMALGVLRDGGFMVVDNTLWDGHVTDSAYDHDAQTCAIRRFNDLVAADDRVEKVILPLRDGLTLIRKK
ncbi:MAG: class I SAM-dependent methyltransferase [Prevotella sp.]|nr:class I SAM-dependent methyltransferase [Prevotella sp.]